jgi:hypothetical protein
MDELSERFNTAAAELLRVAVPYFAQRNEAERDFAMEHGDERGRARFWDDAFLMTMRTVVGATVDDCAAAADRALIARAKRAVSGFGAIPADEAPL